MRRCQRSPPPSPSADAGSRSPTRKGAVSAGGGDEARPGALLRGRRNRRWCRTCATARSRSRPTRPGGAARLLPQVGADHFPEWIERVTVQQAGRIADPNHRRPRRDDGLPRRAERDHATRVALTSRPPARAGPLDHRPRSRRRRVLRHDPGDGAGGGRAPARRRTRALCHGDWLARHPRGAAAQARSFLWGGHRFARGIAEAMVAEDPDRLNAGMASRRAWQANLPRRQPDQLRPACGRAVRVSGRGRPRRSRCRSNGTSSPIAAWQRIAGTFDCAGPLRSDGDAWRGISRRARQLPG